MFLVYKNFHMHSIHWTMHDLYIRAQQRMFELDSDSPRKLSKVALHEIHIEF